MPATTQPSGQNLPPELKKLGGLRKVVNAIRAFSISSRIISVILRPVQGGVIPKGRIKPYSTGSIIEIDVAPSGEGGVCEFFKLSNATTEEDGSRVRVSASTINGTIPSEFAGGVWIFGVSAYGEVYVHITIDDDGAITAKDIAHAASTPTDTDTEFYQAIGFFDVDGDGNVTVGNLRCGPVMGVVCRNWFSNPGTYGITWS